MSARHHGTHDRLYRRPKPNVATAEKVDAIIVPSARTAPYLREAAGLAQELNCRLVVLCSKLANRRDIVGYLDSNFLAVDLVAIDLPAPISGRMPSFETTRMLAETPFVRRTDTSLKRNLGLCLARAAGWKRIMFMDDDIAVRDPADIRRAAAHLDAHHAVGMHQDGFPDNSVVCHAHRDAGGKQGMFVGAGALAVNVERMDSFFPDIYNEDWFFLLDDSELRPVTITGEATQQPYDPFRNPDRARAEEFGDDLAEGVFALLDDGGRIEDADLAYWSDFLGARAALIEDISRRVAASDIERGQRDRMFAALKAARGRLCLISPELCVAYLDAWRRDRVGWQRFLAEVPAPMGVTEALKYLGLRGCFTMWDGSPSSGVREGQSGKGRSVTYARR
jgi:glycosyltransferase involved in cell wall biosynthesis